MDSYITDIELELKHWLYNVKEAAHSSIVRQAMIVGYYGGCVDNSNCREHYGASMELFKQAQSELNKFCCAEGTLSPIEGK